MNSPNLIDLPADQLHLDETLKTSGVFSVRVTNALMRKGIITPRLLVMHTIELLHRDVENLGSIGLAEIVDVVTKQGWNLAKTTDEKQVTLFRLLAVAFYKVIHPLTISVLTQKVNQYSRVTWNESEVSEAANCHPYIHLAEKGRYHFRVSSIGTSIMNISSKNNESAVVQKVATGQAKILLSEL